VDSPEHVLPASTVSRLFRSLADSPLGALLRNIVDRRSFRLAEQRLSSIGKKRNIPCLNIDEIVKIRQSKSADTLFIFGSGQSINLLSDENFGEISSQVSVGINHWTLHQFQPDIYAVELIDSIRGNRAIHNENHHREKFGIEGHLSHLRYIVREENPPMGRLILTLPPRSDFEYSQLQYLDDAWIRKTRLYGRVTPYTRRPQFLQGAMSRVLTRSKKSPKTVIVPDSGATLARMLGIGLLAGFSNIVLLGIDLSTTYFWEAHGALLVDSSLTNFPSGQKGGVHQTLLRENRPFGVLEVLAAYGPILNKNAVTLFVGNNTSKHLAGLEDYSWVSPSRP
jgi:hypothetical protein